MALEYLFVDFDSFFASVEQQDRAELRGRPVGVVPRVGVETTCCIAASYEAKQKGVKTGTNVREARFKCPGIVFVQGAHQRYIEVHHAMMAAIEGCLHIEKILSIDECYGRLPPHWREPSVVRAKCAEIKAAVAAQVGRFVTCSIGVAPNRFLAKLASKMRKPDGCQFIDYDDLPDILYALELDDLHGIGKQLLRRLNEHGIHTMRQLCAANASRLGRIWGSIYGVQMWKQLRGVETGEIATVRRSVSHSHILPPALRKPDKALAVLHKQLQKACRRLRAMDYYAGGLSVSVKFGFQWRWQREVKVFPTQDTLTFAQHLNRLWQSAPADDVPTQVRVELWALVPAQAHTPSLFEGDNQARRVALQRAMDSLTLRFGNAAVYFASAHEAHQQGAAPMRIAFTHIPDLKLEQEPEASGGGRNP